MAALKFPISRINQIPFFLIRRMSTFEIWIELGNLITNQLEGIWLSSSGKRTRLVGFAICGNLNWLNHICGSEFYVHFFASGRWWSHQRGSFHFSNSSQRYRNTKIVWWKSLSKRFCFSAEMRLVLCRTSEEALHLINDFSSSLQYIVICRQDETGQKLKASIPPNLKVFFFEEVLVSCWTS